MTTNQDTGPLDACVAAVELMARAGAEDLKVHLREGVPAQWWATAVFQGRAMRTGREPGPTEALGALASQVLERIARGAMCECGQLIRIRPPYQDGCRWQEHGNHWVSDCELLDAASVLTAAGSAPAR